MAIVLDFPAATVRTSFDAARPDGGGELVAMRHVDLTTVIETIRVIRDLGRGHLLDAFNGGGTAPSRAARPTKVRSPHR